MAEKKSIELSGIQQWMQEMLLGPQGRYERLNQSGVSPPDQLHSLEEMIKPSKKLSAADHLGIYQRSYLARLRDCMAKQFSALEYALGKDLFCGFADAYLQQYPSRNYNLITLGEHFADFLEDTRPDKHQAEKEDWPDFMIELARFEYALNIIFEEKVEEGYLLADSTVGNDGLQLIPSFHLYSFNFPIKRYYVSFAMDKQPELPLPEKTYCAVKRHDYELKMYDINRGQYIFLGYLKSGMTFDRARQRLESVNGVRPHDFNDRWPMWKEKWIEAGFFRLSSS